MIETLALVVGSKTDLKRPQCREGLRYLKREALRVRVILTEICVMSAQRNVNYAIEFLRRESGLRNINAIVAAAGRAAHLPRDLDAILGYELHNQNIPVIGVEFDDSEDISYALAAKLSIAEASGTRVIYRDATGPFVGEHRFLRACKYAVSGRYPKLKAMEPKEALFLTLDQALAMAEEETAVGKVSQKA